MTYCFGNHLGNIYFVWKLEDCDDMDQQRTSAVHFVLNSLPQYSTRKMRHDFINTYKSVNKPHILRNIYKCLTNDSSAPETTEQGEIDDRVIDFFLGSDDPELLIDLRGNNGKVPNTKYDLFWEKLGNLLEELSVVHERRENETGYFSDFISTRDLVEQVLQNVRQTPLIPMNIG